MRPSRLIRVFTIVYLGAICLPVLKKAEAQSPTVNPYRTRTASTPTVSPYLSLSVDANGVSNYSTLVRPMLSQREWVARQMAEEQLRTRPQLAQGRSSGSAAKEDAQRDRSAGSFMNYSHYFGRVR